MIRKVTSKGGFYCEKDIPTEKTAQKKGAWLPQQNEY